MLAAFLSSPWFAFLVLAGGLALVCGLVIRASTRIRKDQAHREAQALAQAQVALEEWRRNRSALASPEKGQSGSG